MRALVSDLSVHLPKFPSPTTTTLHQDVNIENPVYNTVYYFCDFIGQSGDTTSDLTKEKGSYVVRKEITGLLKAFKLLLPWLILIVDLVESGIN